MAKEKTKESAKISKPEEDVWVEKYRPRNLDDLIVPQRVKERLRKGVNNSMIFHGEAGTGKTSAARILAEPHPHKHMNASVSRKIEDVEKKIMNFVSSMALDVSGNRSSFKVVILDEIDGVSEGFMKAMRGVMEEYWQSARFIATCNYFHTIPAPMKSRFECINFDWSEDEEKEVKKNFGLRVAHICKQEGMTIDNNAVLKILTDRFPDMRSSINILQGLRSSGIEHVKEEHLDTFQGAFKDVFELIFDGKEDPVKIYEELGKYRNKVDAVIESLGKDFIEYIKMERDEKAMDKIGPVIDEVNKHSWQRHFAIDPWVTLLSLVFKLQNIVKS